MSVKLDTTTKKYYAVFSYKDEHGTLKWRKKRGFDRKKDALIWEHAEAKRIAEQVAEKKNTLPTFWEVSEMRLADAGVRESTAYAKRSRLRNHFGMYLDTPVDQITKADLINWRLEVMQKPLKTSSKNVLLKAVKEVFKFSHETYDTPNVGTALKTIPETKEEANEEMEVWSVDEFNQFLTAVDNRLCAVYYEFAFWTGARRGEISAILKENITPDGWCTISETYSDPRFGVSDTKNRKIRTIKLDPVLMEHIKPLLEAPGPYLFGGEDPIDPKAFYNPLYRYADRAGVKRITLHCFRHSHVSILYDHGVSTKAIAERIGDTEQTVLNTYKHLMARQEDHMNNVIESLHTV